MNKKNIEKNVVTVTEWLQAVITDSTNIKYQCKGATWWHPALTVLKNRVNTLATKLRRWLPTTRRQVLEDKFLDAKKEYRKEMAKARDNKFWSFVTNHQAWGRPYKFIVKKWARLEVPVGLIKPDRMTTATSDKSIKLLMEVKFPKASACVHPTSAAELVLIDEAEYTNATEIANLLKGPDRIRYKHLELLHKKHPWILATVFNDCMELCYFLRQWKEGIAV